MGVAGFVGSRAVGAIIGEYAKDIWFRKSRRELKRLKAQHDVSNLDMQILEAKVLWALDLIAKYEEEHHRLLRELVRRGISIQPRSEPNTTPSEAKPGEADTMLVDGDNRSPTASDVAEHYEASAPVAYKLNVKRR